MSPLVVIIALNLTPESQILLFHLVKIFICRIFSDAFKLMFLHIIYTYMYTVYVQLSVIKGRLYESPTSYWSRPAFTNVVYHTLSMGYIMFACIGYMYNN